MVACVCSTVYPPSRSLTILIPWIDESKKRSLRATTRRETPFVLNFLASYRRILPLCPSHPPDYSVILEKGRPVWKASRKETENSNSRYDPQFRPQSTNLAAWVAYGTSCGFTPNNEELKINPFLLVDTKIATLFSLPNLTFASQLDASLPSATMESDDSANSSHPPVFTKLRRGRRIPDSTEAPAKRRERLLKHSRTLH